MLTESLELIDGEFGNIRYRYIPRVGATKLLVVLSGFLCPPDSFEYTRQFNDEDNFNVLFVKEHVFSAFIKSKFDFETVLKFFSSKPGCQEKWIWGSSLGGTASLLLGFHCEFNHIVAIAPHLSFKLKNSRISQLVKSKEIDLTDDLIDVDILGRLCSYEHGRVDLVFPLHSCRDSIQMRLFAAVQSERVNASYVHAPHGLEKHIANEGWIKSFKDYFFRNIDADKILKTLSQRNIESINKMAAVYHALFDAKYVDGIVIDDGDYQNADFLYYSSQNTIKKEYSSIAINASRRACELVDFNDISYVLSYANMLYDSGSHFEEASNVYKIFIKKWPNSVDSYIQERI